MAHVFLSYARKDGKTFVERLDAALPQHGYPTWRDKRGIDPTQDFTAEIEKAIEAASHVVVCLTPDTLRDNSFVRREIVYAQLCHKPIFVARFADVRPQIQIVTNTWMDFFRGWDEALDALLTWLAKPAPPSAPPPAPADPYKAYLDALYKQIVAYLDKTVFTMLPNDARADLIALHAADTPDAVTPPPDMDALVLSPLVFDLAGVSADADAAPRTYDHFHAAFERYDGRVLLLGEPGAGKSTTLMAFARDAVARRLSDARAPLPVVAPITSWDAYRKPAAADWLASAVPALKGRIADVLARGGALLLLDGLDELGSARPVDPNRHDGETFDPRPPFIERIPADNRVLVTCRVKDYQEIGAKLALKGAVTLHPLDDAQMQAYLRGVPDLWDVLAADEGLRSVARTPLLLSFFAYAFAGLGAQARALRSLGAGDIRDKVFETYIQRRYAWEERKAQARGETLPFTLAQVYDGLGAAAAGNVWFWAEENVISLERTLTPELAAFAVDLNLMRLSDERHYAFVHLLLRDYLGYLYAMKHLNDPNKHVRVGTIQALEAIMDARAVKPLIDALRDPDAGVRGIATIALVKIGEPAVEALLAALDAQANVHNSIAYVLGKIGDARAVEPLIAALRDPDGLVRHDTAARALEAIATSEGWRRCGAGGRSRTSADAACGLQPSAR